MKKLKYIDLFCGIGGFHRAFEAACEEINVESECVFSSDIDQKCREAYQANFGIHPHGDITEIDEKEIPSHDVLLAGFPCQAFSIIGDRKGFKDTRGTLFFDIARILKEKRPEFFVLENVKQLRGHDKGRTLEIILNTLNELGYSVNYQVLNALDFGLPQKRERIFLVGSLGHSSFNFDDLRHPKGSPTLSSILEKQPSNRYFASAHIQERRQEKVKRSQIEHGRPTIWHENKSGNISAYEFSCALRAGASYNYLLVDGKRRLTEREMLRLQGFPDEHKIIGSYSEVRKQAGNSLPISVAQEVIFNLLMSHGYGSVHHGTEIKKSSDSKAAL